MATRTIEAIYTGGLLRPLDPLPFAEGEHVTLAILSERERVEAALAPLLVKRPALPSSEEATDVEALRHRLHEVTRGLSSLSEELVEERRNGP